jgi:hypothetical protein
LGHNSDLEFMLGLRSEKRNNEQDEDHDSSASVFTFTQTSLKLSFVLLYILITAATPLAKAPNPGKSGNVTSS